MPRASVSEQRPALSHYRRQSFTVSSSVQGDLNCDTSHHKSRWWEGNGFYLLYLLKAQSQPIYQITSVEKIIKSSFIFPGVEQRGDALLTL